MNVTESFRYEGSMPVAAPSLTPPQHQIISALFPSSFFLPQHVLNDLYVASSASRLHDAAGTAVSGDVASAVQFVRFASVGLTVVYVIDTEAFALELRDNATFGRFDAIFDGIGLDMLCPFPYADASTPCALPPTRIPYASLTNGTDFSYVETPPRLFERPEDIIQLPTCANDSDCAAFRSVRDAVANISCLMSAACPNVIAGGLERDAQQGVLLSSSMAPTLVELLKASKRSSLPSYAVGVFLTASGVHRFVADGSMQGLSVLFDSIERPSIRLASQVPDTVFVSAGTFDAADIAISMAANTAREPFVEVNAVAHAEFAFAAFAQGVKDQIVFADAEISIHVASRFCLVERTPDLRCYVLTHDLKVVLSAEGSAFEDFGAVEPSISTEMMRRGLIRAEVARDALTRSATTSYVAAVGEEVEFRTSKVAPSKPPLIRAGARLDQAHREHEHHFRRDRVDERGSSGAAVLPRSVG
jgi:hypothetical protein